MENGGLCVKLFCDYRLWLGLLFCWAPGIVNAMATASSDWALVADALEANTQPQVRALSSNDRLALQAVLALKQHREARALEILDAVQGDADPLLNVITAEAYRRQAVKALQKAGAYAHPVQRQSQLLANTHLQSGFGEAEAKLALLRDRLRPTQGMPSDLLALSADVANVFMVDKQQLLVTLLFVKEELFIIQVKM